MRRRSDVVGVLAAFGVVALSWAMPGQSLGQGTCPDPRPAPAGPAVYIEDLNLDAAGDAVITVKLAAGGQQIAGTQNDIVFDANVRVKARSNGRPDCAVNPDINKNSTSFAFQPSGCSGETCTGLRAIVFASDNVDPIPDGSVLYTCNVTVAGSGTLNVANARGSDPNGQAVAGFGGREGNVCIPTPGGGTCPDPRPAPAGPAVYIEDLNLDAAGDAVITVKLAAGGQQIAGTQNDIVFDANVRVKARSNGRPDCAVNPDINKNSTSFAFQPSGCSGETCTGLRAIVFASDNVDPIPDGSVLYTCNVTVAGSGTLNVTNARGSDPNGQAVAGFGGREGNVCIPTPGGGTCPDPRPAPAGPAVYIEDLNLDAAGDAVITVKLAAGGQQIAGTQNDIVFDANVRVKARSNGRPDCAVNPDINKNSTSFAFQPSGCSGETCTGLRAIVFASDNVDPIPDGSVLYTCNVTVAGSGTLNVANARGSDPNGQAVAGFGGREGNVCVRGAQPPTPTPTEALPTLTPTITVPPATPTFTSTPPPTNTPTTRATATPSPTATSAVVEDEDGCHIVANGSSALSWWLLAPLAVLLLRRRARR
ncbi:MAG: hypothetical protein KatS3mg077_3049 [Candidatus Binatia bacterium]|nr:MAG: hypothetical protein KatS3mg077_3049 [Candidatus Binatia bacterium]